MKTRTYLEVYVSYGAYHKTLEIEVVDGITDEKIREHDGKGLLPPGAYARLLRSMLDAVSPYTRCRVNGVDFTDTEMWHYILQDGDRVEWLRP